MKYIGIALAVLCLYSCKEHTSTSHMEKDLVTHEKGSYQEKYRAQFHFSPPTHWMNDPNGLVFYKDKYHLFYQYYPEDIVWGPMHWGHATSKDLFRWEHEPIALYPDSLGYIFSGSAVVDTNNTSGFGSTENPPLVSIFTYHLMEGEQAGRKDFQTQGIAYSLDEGKTWFKYEGNPVIGNDGIKDFRDPKVFWHDESKQWIMVLVAGDHAKFYSSNNLKSWEYLSEFGRDKGAHGGVWECPDLFKLPVEGTATEQWVLLVSINPGAPNGGSGTQYFVGNFDGSTFTTSQEVSKWIDYGRDNYAGITYNNLPNEERVFIGWMSNWDYAQKTPTATWRSAMTIPRKITLYEDDEQGYRIKNYPVVDTDTFSKLLYEQPLVDLEKPFSYKNDRLQQSEIVFFTSLSKAQDIIIKNDNGAQFSFKIDPQEQQLLFDRRQSGRVDFEPRFAQDLQKQSYSISEKPVEVRILLDASSVEIFIDKGKYVFTNQLFPEKPYTTLVIEGAKEATLQDLSINHIESIW